VIETVLPEVDEGRFPAKAVPGEPVLVEADIYAGGHESLAADVLFRKESETQWAAVPMLALGNDRWRAHFPVEGMTTYVFTIEAWLAPFATWCEGLAKKADAGQKLDVELLIGARLIEGAAARATPGDAAVLRAFAKRLAGKGAPRRLTTVALDEGLAALMRRWADKTRASRYHRELCVVADPPKAGCSAWYEMFPRSLWSGERGAQGTLRHCEKRLPYIAELGFDVLYLPPVHPIGKTHRKGENNAVRARAGDPGSPWAIGSKDGGHKAIDPQLGTLEDFRRLVTKARGMGIDVALDIAFQCSPDHPYVKEHPEWFSRRPDGSVQYAENPPKKYEDIYPFNFETADWESLWQELKSVFLFWIEQGVRIFRVDNPHTKPFRFWEWLIAEVKREHADVIFLAEAFTRPKIMYHLAKLGFTQSYTYFAWRNGKLELSEYFTELTQTSVADFFRPNVWPNTPDILTEQMQTGGRAAFIARLVLAATLSANYGIYGPALELMEHTPREPGSEEYLHSEKYEIRRWDIKRPDSLRELITRVNVARKEHRALQTNRGLRFHNVENDHLICYSKATDDASDVIIVVVNLDCGHTQSGWADLPIEDWGISAEERYQVHDLLSDARYTWQGRRNYVELDPQASPAHVFHLRRRGAGGRESA
jgi:starch synthase (maltosyl-transferring)